MKMFNVYAAALALLVVSNGVKANDMMMSAMPLSEYGVQNVTSEHVCIKIESHNGKMSSEACLFKDNVLSLTREQFNDIKSIHIEVSSAKGKKVYKLSHFRANGATNEIPLRHLAYNIHFNYLLVTKNPHGHLALEAVNKADVKNYGMIPATLNCPVK